MIMTFGADFEARNSCRWVIRESGKVMDEAEASRGDEIGFELNFGTVLG
jgi:hypothetical protein